MEYFDPKYESVPYFMYSKLQNISKDDLIYCFKEIIEKHKKSYKDIIEDMFYNDEGKLNVLFNNNELEDKQKMIEALIEANEEYLVDIIENIPNEFRDIIPDKFKKDNFNINDYYNNNVFNLKK